MARVVLLSGLPGIGKSTVARSLPDPFFERIHFGGLLRQVVEERDGSSLPHEVFRERFHGLLDSHVLHAATLLARDQARRSTSKVCVLDSHAVTPTPIGLRVTPDNLGRISLLRFDGIVHLSSSGCFDRVVANSTKQGRQPIRDSEALTAEQLQLSVCTLYASAHDCPLLVISAVGEPLATTVRVEEAVRSMMPSITDG